MASGPGGGPRTRPGERLGRRRVRQRLLLDGNSSCAEVYKHHSWWQMVALLSAITGLLTVIPFVVALIQTHIGIADLGVQINVWLRILGSVAVIAIVRVPTVQSWVLSRL